MTVVAPLLVGVLYVCLSSLIRQPYHRSFNAIMVAGTGATYLSGGGLSSWELAFTAVLTYVAYRSLESWTLTGVGWLLHTGWDILHHLHGNPIIPFAHDSSLGCTICDPDIAIWCLVGGPSITTMLHTRTARQRPTS
jgi:hypothetical protein